MDEFLEAILRDLDKGLVKRGGLDDAQPFLFGYDFPETKTQYHFHGRDEDHLTYGKLVDYDRTLLAEEKSSFNLAMVDLTLQSGGFDRFPKDAVVVPMKEMVDLGAGYVDVPFPSDVPYAEPQRADVAYKEPAYVSSNPILPAGVSNAQEALYWGVNNIVAPQDSGMRDYHAASGLEEIANQIEQVREAPQWESHDNTQYHGSHYEPEQRVEFGASYVAEPEPDVQTMEMEREMPQMGSVTPDQVGTGWEPPSAGLPVIEDPNAGMPEFVVPPWETSVPPSFMDAGGEMCDGF